MTRAFQRYDVRHADGIRAQIAQKSGAYHLFTLGGGGCSFIGKFTELELVPPCMVQLQFDTFADGLLDSSQTVKGELLYVRPYDIRNELMLFGFKFSMNDRMNLDSIIHDLEVLASEGFIERA